MEVKELTDAQRDEWDIFASKEPCFSLQQSWGWGEVKERLGWKAYRIAVREKGTIIAGAQLLNRAFPFGLASFSYVPRGPVGDWQDPQVSALLFSALHSISRSHRAVCLKIEPPILDNPATPQFLQQHNFRAAHETIQPRATIIIDLLPDLDCLFGQMRKSTRRKIKNADRRGVTVRTGCEVDLPAFYQLMKTTCARAGFSLRSIYYYQNEWNLLGEHGRGLFHMAYFQDRLLAVNIIYGFGGHAAFFHQASCNEYAHLNPNSLLAWESIKWLKEKGYRTLDLWGIPDEVGEIASHGGELPGHGRTDGLWGVYQFKSGLCKNVVYYVGAYDHVYRPLVYRLTSGDLITKSMEKIAIQLESLKHKNPFTGSTSIV